MNPIYQHEQNDTLSERRSGFARRRVAPPTFSGTERRRFSDRRGSSGKPYQISTDQLTFKKNSRLLKRLFQFFIPINGKNDRNDSRIKAFGQTQDATHLIDRAHDRIDIKSPISIQDNDTFKVYPGTLYNHSQAGMYIETESAPRIHSGVVIKMQNYASNATAPEDIRKYYGQVRWCRKLSGMVVFVNYGVGIKLCCDLDDFIKTFGL
jgi:hypothetical protein